MTQLATIAPDASDFAPRLREILEASGVPADEFESLDWFALLPFYALAGASIATHVHAHGDHFHFQGVTITIPDELEDGFYAVLPQLLAQLQEE